MLDHWFLLTRVSNLSVTLLRQLIILRKYFDKKIYPPKKHAIILKKECHTIYYTIAYLIKKYELNTFEIFKVAAICLIFLDMYS